MDYKHLPRVLSFMFPGMGQILLKKWLTGIIFIFIHVFVSVLMLRIFVRVISYYKIYPDGEIVRPWDMFIVCLFVLILNGIISIITARPADSE
jgi:hypothetical protein